jgi:hypothetical protein
LLPLCDEYQSNNSFSGNGECVMLPFQTVKAIPKTTALMNEAGLNNNGKLPVLVILQKKHTFAAPVIRHYTS